MQRIIAVTKQRHQKDHLMVYKIFSGVHFPFGNGFGTRFSIALCIASSKGMNRIMNARANIMVTRMKVDSGIFRSIDMFVKLNKLEVICLFPIFEMRSDSK